MRSVGVGEPDVGAAVVGEIQVVDPEAGVGIQVGTRISDGPAMLLPILASMCGRMIGASTSRSTRSPVNDAWAPLPGLDPQAADSVTRMVAPTAFLMRMSRLGPYQ